MGIVVPFIISLIAGIILVNSIYNGFMRIIGADGMFFSVKAKLFWYAIASFVILGIINKIFGLGLF